MNIDLYRVKVIQVGPITTVCATAHFRVLTLQTEKGDVTLSLFSDSALALMLPDEIVDADFVVQPETEEEPDPDPRPDLGDPIAATPVETITPVKVLVEGTMR